MKFMTTWRIPPSSYDEALDRFLAGGAPLPEGLTMLGRWHAPGSNKGFLLVEADDLTLLAEHLGEWAGLLECEVTPVLQDEEAAAAASRVRGR